MCLIDTPTTSNTASSQTDLPVLRNTYLDGVDPVRRAASSGISALRINRDGSGVQSPSSSSGSALQITPAGSSSGGVSLPGQQATPSTFQRITTGGAGVTY